MKGILVLVASFASVASAAEIDGVLQWSRRTELSVPVSGVVATVPVQAGERVTKGASLLTLDATPFAAAVSAAEAQVARRKSERDEAARDAKQAQELFDRTVLSVVELENAKMKLARAEAGAREAAAQLDRARYQRNVSTLRAPFDAVVLSRHIEAGQSLSAELKPPVLFVIAAAGEYVAQARLTPERAAGLRVGQSATVVVGGKKYDGKLRALTYDSAGKEPGMVLDAVITTGDALVAGQSARIVLP